MSIVRPANLAPAVAAALLCALAASCRSVEAPAPPRLAMPRVLSSVRHFRGSPLSGPLAAADTAVPDDSLQVVVRLFALERLPPDLLDPLGPQVRLLVAVEGGKPIRAAADLLAGARAGAVDAEALIACLERGDHGRSVEVAELRGVLPVSVTAAFELVRPHPGEPGRPSQDERFRLAVRRTLPPETPGLEAAVEVDAVRGEPRAPLLRRELAVLDARPYTGRNEAAILAPAPFPGEEAGAIVAIIAIRPAPAEGGIGANAHRAALAACRADLARDAVRLARAPPASPAPPRGGAAPDTTLARGALLDPVRRRGALYGLAQSTGAPLAEDVALAAAEPLLVTVTAAIAAELRSSYVPSSGPALGWVVERGAMRSLDRARRADSGPSAAEIFLLRRLGPVARDAESFRDVLEQTRDLADLERRLADANRALLDDGDAGMRVRAQEWLLARDLAPKGYDPLAPVEARRAALEAAGGGTGGAVGGKAR